MSPSQGRGSGAHSHHPRIGDRVEHLGASAQQLWGEARGAAEDLSQTLNVRSRVDKHPYLMLAAAAGVGYFLGGGLFTSFTAKLAGIGIQVAAITFLKHELANVAEGAFAGFSSRSKQGRQSPRTGR